MSNPPVPFVDRGKPQPFSDWLAAHTPEFVGAAVCGIILLSVVLATRYVSQADWVRHSLDIQTKIREVRSSVQDMEIGQRTFALTGDEQFARRFMEAEKQTATYLADLRTLVGDNDAQIQNVDAIAESVLAWERSTEKILDTRRSAGLEGAKALITETAAVNAANTIRASIDHLAEDESKLLDHRTAAASRTTHWLTAAIALGLFATVASMGAWIINARRSARDLSEKNKELVQMAAERAAAEDQVRQMQKMEAIGQLTGGIAHDFNNMLAIIMGGHSLADRTIGRNDADAKRYLKGAQEGAQRAASLVKRLMAFARVAPLSPQAVDANKIVAGLSELITRAIGSTIEIETILAGGLWATNADPQQLENSILNLCVNARDAMPDGGRLTVETANCHLDDYYARTHPGVSAGQYVLIAITDTGSGMTPDVIARAFEPFFTTKALEKGTGLGLSQTYGFVKQSGGHIKIYSEPGHGTTIKIYLPRYYQPQSSSSPGDRGEPQEVRGSETILVVDDEQAVLDVTSESLEDLGYKVHKAATHDQAIAIIGTTDIDLLLTDIIMPGSNGRKLAEKAEEMRPGLRVLFMTGFTRNAVVHHGVLDPGVHFLSKPFSIAELSHKVREALGSRTVEKA